MPTQKRLRLQTFLLISITISTALLPSFALAQTLRLGLAGEPTSLDPHQSQTSANQALAKHIFDTLLRLDADRGVLMPRLAQSWRNIDSLTWEFKLRPGIRFHDGSPLTADDVVTSLKRPDVIKTAGGFTNSTRQFAEITAVDPLTIRVRTIEPSAGTPGSVSNIFIVPKKSASLSVEDFNSGKGVIGTGPYKLVRWQRGERIELERNDSYWNGAVVWDKLIMRPLNSGATRVAALLAGDVDVIEGVPAQDVLQLRSQPQINVVSVESLTTNYVYLDVAREQTPWVRDLEGNPLPRNPFKDVRVRRALSLAIDRKAIAERVADRMVVPAGNLLPTSFVTSSGLPPDPYDPSLAKKLLAEAGYPNGFALTLHASMAPNSTGEKMFQSIAQMWSRVGIKTELYGFPWAIFYPKAQKRELSVMIAGLGGASHASSYLRNMVMTVNADKGNGAFNLGQYSNPAIDALLERAYTEFDEEKSNPLWRQASTMALQDYAVIPLFHSNANWGMRKGIRMTPHRDASTHAQDLAPEKTP